MPVRCGQPGWCRTSWVCADTWAPDPAEVQALAGQPGVSAILIVSPFGAPLDLPAWDRVQAATGVPVVIDGAAAFDTLRAGGPMAVGRCPVIVSLHAPKVFGIGEGGALIGGTPPCWSGCAAWRTSAPWAPARQSCRG